MSDQDFFFDEEDEKPAKAEKATTKSSSSKSPAAKSTASKPASSRSTTSRPAASKATPAPAASGSFFDQSVGMSVVVLLTVVALLLGMVVGLFVGQSRAQQAGVGTIPTTSTGTGNGSAPPLSQDQLNSGKLPAGHPSIGSSSTPSKNATGK